MMRAAGGFACNMEALTENAVLGFMLLSCYYHAEAMTEGIPKARTPKLYRHIGLWILHGVAGQK